MCHLMTLAKWQYLFNRRHSILKAFVAKFFSKIDKKMTWHFGWPPPPVSFGDTEATPPRVSRIIWMAPKRVTVVRKMMPHLQYWRPISFWEIAYPLARDRRNEECYTGTWWACREICRARQRDQLESPKTWGWLGAPKIDEPLETE